MSQIEPILRTLVEIPTVVGNHDAMRRALDFIEDFVRSRGMHVARHTVQGVESLVATTRPTKAPAVMLAGHIDVVPAPDDFFQLRRVGDKYYGRGVHDMKDSIAVFLQVIDDLKDRLHEYDFGLMLTTDEEVGGFNGTAALLEKGYRSKVCVLPDGGDSWKLETHAKGVMAIDIRTFGKTAHGSRPWDGDNAITKLLALLEEVRSVFPNTDKTASTLSVTQIAGGEAFNQIPDNASVTLDVRPTTSKDQREITERLQRICKKYGAEMDFRFNEPPCFNDLNNPYIAEFVKSMEAALGRPIESTLALAGSDARHFGRYGIPCAVMYLEGGGHHSMTEWLDAKSLEIFRTGMHTFLNQTATGITGHKTDAPALTQANQL